MAEQDTLKGFRASALRVGVTGAVRVAKLGSPLPKLGEKYNTDTYRNVGYISSEGVAVSFDEDAKEYIPWQELAPIRREITKSITSVKLKLWDFGKENAEMFFGAKATKNDDGSWTLSQSGKPNFERQMFIFDVIDGDEAMRLVLPVGQITAREGINFKSEEEISLGVTITAYPAGADDYPDAPGVEGETAVWTFSKGWDGTGAESITKVSTVETSSGTPATSGGR